MLAVILGEGWYGPSPFLSSESDVLRKRKLDHEEFVHESKESRKRVFGAVMSAAEKKAMDMEIQRQSLAEYDRKHIREIDAQFRGAA